MEKKNSSGISGKKAGLVSAALLTALFILRMYQSFSLIDPATGFFTDRGNITVIPFYILAIGSVFAVLILFWFTGKTEGFDFEDKKDIPLAAASLIFTAFMFYAAIKRLLPFFSQITYYGSLKNSIKVEGGTTVFLGGIFALLAAFALLCVFLSFVSGKIFARKLKILMLAPVIWAFFDAIGYFRITSSYLKTTHLMLTIFAKVFLMLFLFQFAKFISGINVDSSVWSFYALGMISTALILTTEIPNLIFSVAMPERLIVNCPLVPENLAAAVFAVTAMIFFSKNTKKAEN